MININDYRKEDGMIDWKACEIAEINNGERCYECKSLMFFGQGASRLCSACSSKDKQEEWSDDGRIRCPKCGNVEDVSEKEDGDLYSDDCHEVYCNECNFKYEIVTSVSYTFKSPELEKIK